MMLTLAWMLLALIQSALLVAHMRWLKRSRANTEKALRMVEDLLALNKRIEGQRDEALGMLQRHP